MPNLQEALLSNEETFLLNCSDKSARCASVQRINSFKNLTSDGDLVRYINLFCRTEKGLKRKQEFHEHNLKWIDEIVADYKTSLNIDDYTRIDDLVIGKEYSRHQIALLTNNFYVDKGMYFSRDKNNDPFLCIKSTLNGNGRYPDTWLNTEMTKLRYHIRDEDNAASIMYLDYKYQENRIIFDSLIIQYKLPIYIFTRNDQKEAFIYRGCFYANKVFNDHETFELVRKDIYNDSSLFAERRAFIDNYNSSQLSDHEASSLFAQINMPTKNKKQRLNFDSIDSEYIKKAMMYFEYRRVEKFSKSCAMQIGFKENKINSFDKVNDTISILLKSTKVNDKYMPFEISIDERKEIESDPKHICIYRIFDCRSSKPTFFSISGTQFSNLSMTERSFLCDIK